LTASAIRTTQALHEKDVEVNQRRTAILKALDALPVGARPSDAAMASLRRQLTAALHLGELEELYQVSVSAVLRLDSR
jgi:hypothetical protein